MKIIAKKGYVGNLYIANLMVEINAFDPYDLSSFTEEQIEKSNLKGLMDAGWVVEYNGEDLPQMTSTKKKGLEIPKLSVESDADKGKVTFTQQHNKSRVSTTVNLPEGFADDIHKKLAANKTKKAEIPTLKSNKDVTSEAQIKPLTSAELRRAGVGSYVAQKKDKPGSGLGAADLHSDDDEFGPEINE